MAGETEGSSRPARARRRRLVLGGPPPGSDPHDPRPVLSRSSPKPRVEQYEFRRGTTTQGWVVRPAMRVTEGKFETCKAPREAVALPVLEWLACGK